MSYGSMEDLKNNCSTDVVEKNAGKLGINLPPPVTSGMDDDEAYLLLVRGEKPIKQNKYHVSSAPDRTYHGIVFGSKKEAAKAAELDLCVQAGEITFYLRQVPFIVGYDPLTKYVADFVTFKGEWRRDDKDYHQFVWTIKVIETKGMYAPGAKRKLSLFKKKFPDMELEVC